MKCAIALLALAGFLIAPTFWAQNAGDSGTATLLSLDNRVEAARGGGGWAAAVAGQSLNVGDRIRTGEDSRAKLRIGDGSILELDELTTIEIKPPKDAGTSATLNVPSGAAYFFSRGKSREVSVETPSANGAIRGTAFLLKVNPYDGRTSVSMMDGAFELSNMGGVTNAVKGEQAEIAWGSLPSKTELDDRGNSGPWYLVIENGLRTLRPLGATDRSDFFDALPAVTKEWRFVSPQLAGAATIKKREWAKDILESSFRAVGPDCPLLKRILASVIDADPGEASELTELAIKLFPKCADEFQTAARGGKGNKGFSGGPPSSLNGEPGSGAGINNSGQGQGNAIAICHNMRTIFVSPQEAAQLLQNNPGDTLGPCQVTPSQNR